MIFRRSTTLRVPSCSTRTRSSSQPPCSARSTSSRVTKLLENSRGSVSRWNSYSVARAAPPLVPRRVGVVCSGVDCMRPWCHGDGSLDRVAPRPLGLRPAPLLRETPLLRRTRGARRSSGRGRRRRSLPQQRDESLSCGPPVGALRAGLACDDRHHAVHGAVRGALEHLSSEALGYRRRGAEVEDELVAAVGRVHALTTRTGGSREP